MKTNLSSRGVFLFARSARALLLFFFLFICSGLWGQVSMSATGSYTQDFNTLISSGSGTWADNSTIANWYAKRSGTGTTIAADAGATNSGNLYSYGTGTNTDRALGSLGSGNAAAGNFAWGVLLRNTSGKDIKLSDIKVAYTGEQWRNGGVNTKQSISFYYKTSTSSFTGLEPNTTTGWTAVTALDFQGPIASTTAAALNGNAAANRTVIAATAISASTTAVLPNNSYIMLKWDDPDHTGSDHGLSIDDVTISWTVPTVATPTLTVTPASLTGLDYVQGNASVEKSYTLKGTDLTAGVTVTAPTNFEVSKDNSVWGNSITYTAAEANATAGQTVYVRLKSGLTAGSYGGSTTYVTNVSTGATTTNVSVSGTVTAPPTPTITLGSFTSTAMTYPLGTGPSSSKNASISGASLTNDVSVTTDNTAVWEVSKDNSNWATSVTYATSSSTIGTGQAIYVRLKAGLAVNAYTGTLTASSTGATSKTYALSGSVTQPVITTTPATLAFTQFGYAQGQGPSGNQSFVISGANMAGDITIKSSNGNWQFSTTSDFSGANTGTTITLTKNSTNNNVTSQTIYARLKAGLAQGSYADELQITSPQAASHTATLDGVVTAPVPYINIRAIIGSNPSLSGTGNADNTPNATQNTLFEQQIIGAEQTKNFRVENLGGAQLSVSSISIAGANPGDFYVTSAISNIAANSSADFSVTFKPTDIGQRNAIVVINNNSSNITPAYRYNVRGTGNNAEINVTGNGTGIPSGSTTISATNNTLIGNANANAANPTTVSKEFVIQNLGNVTLTSKSNAISITGADPSQFSVAPTTFSIAAGASQTITVTFQPTSTGVKNAIISIPNNDVTGSEDPYMFAVQGNASSFVTCAVGSELGDEETIAVQDFEGTNPLSNNSKWKATISDIGGGPGASSGIVTGNTPSSGSSPSNSPYYTSSNSGYRIQGSADYDGRSFTFDAIDTSGYGDVTFSVRIAGMSIGSASNGMDNVDEERVLLDVSPDNGVTWYNQSVLMSSSSNIKWSFASATGVGSRDYLVNNAFTTYENGSSAISGVNNSVISTLVLTKLPAVPQLRLRISATSNGDNESWVIDDVMLKAKKLSGTAERIWTGSKWVDSKNADAVPPTSSQKAIIDGDLTLPYTIGGTTYSTLEGCECQINTGKTLNVGTTNDIARTSVPANAVIQGKILNNGMMVLASDSNLQQMDPLAGNDFTASNFVQKRFARLPKMGYNYWSSPVSSQKLYPFSNGGLQGGTPKNRFFVYDEATDLFKNTGVFLLNDDSVFETARGYAIRGMEDFGETMPTSSHEFKFTGVPNNGYVAFTPLKWSDANRGYNLIGNPYPSNIDFDALYSANSAKIYATAYFWTNNDLSVTNQLGSNYKGNNYAIYNLTGGTPAVQIDGDPNQPSSADGVTPNHVIKVGQGFIIKTKSGANDQPLNFTNAMRLTDNGVFFNNKNKVENDKFWLKLISPSNISNTILIGYMPNATNDFEIDFDGELFVIGSDSFYSLLGVKKLAIQGRSAFDREDKVALGNVYSQNGDYRISTSDRQGIFKNGQIIYLKDKLLNKVIDLTNGDYTFQAMKGTDHTRFEIVYKAETLGVGAESKSDLVIYRDRGDQVVRSSKKLGRIELYDASGKLVRVLTVNATETKLETNTLSNGVYILKIENSGEMKTKKFIK